MEVYIRLQLQTAGAALALGWAAGLLYDLLRVVRLALRRRCVTHVTDLVYVLVLGWALLRFALTIGQGELRLYVLPCAALGWMGYLFLFSRWLRPLWRFWAGAVAAFGGFFLKPAKLFLLFLKKAIYFFQKYGTMLLNKQWWPWKARRSRKGEADSVAQIKKAAKKKRKASLVSLMLVVLIVVAGVELVRVYGRLQEAKNQQETVSQQLLQQQQENEALKSDLDKADDPEFIKGLARDQLGLVEDGERIFYDVND